MADEGSTAPPQARPQPRAVVRTSVPRRWRVPAIWLIPLAAAGIAAWLGLNAISKEGPNITISFQTAEGLQAGQSQLKFRDITFGTVQRFQLSPDRRRVLITVSTTKEAEPLLTDGAAFWIVKPRLFAGSVSGLETLVSGAYLQMRPATNSNAAPRREFVGLEEPPVLESEVPGRTFLLTADRIGSVTLGSPIFYRDLTVGEVLGWDIGDMARTVVVHAFIREPYDKYVHDNSHFWNASGLSVKLNGSGVDVELESLRAVLLGGVAFETPGNDGTPVSGDNHQFPLYANQEAAENAVYGRHIPLVAYFPGSVRGLGRGADVTLHGLKIGSVTAVGLTYDAAQDTVFAPVHFDVEPERLAGIGNHVNDDPATVMADLVRRGMRVSLQSANLLTGQMLVAVEFLPNAPPATISREGTDIVIPTTQTGGFEGLQAGAADLMAKVNTIPFDEIGKNLQQTLQGLNTVANGPQLRNALASLAATMVSVQDTVRKLDAGTTPLLQRLPEISADLQKTLSQANRLVGSLDSGYGDNTRFNRDLNRLLVQASEAVTSIRALSDLLTRHPEVLIRGRSNTGAE